MDEMDRQWRRLMGAEDAPELARSLQRGRLIGERPDHAAAGNRCIEASLHRADDEPRVDGDGGLLLAGAERPAVMGGAHARYGDRLMRGEIRRRLRLAPR